MPIYMSYAKKKKKNIRNCPKKFVIQITRNRMLSSKIGFAFLLHMPIFFNCLHQILTFSFLKNKCIELVWKIHDFFCQHPKSGLNIYHTHVFASIYIERVFFNETKKILKLTNLFVFVCRHPILPLTSR